ncbi:TonB-dependent receptor [Mucilaginibacter sp. PAMB04274]|uniref:TonB-dependent receptor n=1 Tax=Mucilaginibacter sp. PAMB04274 TaxID=3138568 RepID=UPI0031F69EEB
MKITLMLCLIAIMQVSARTFAQKVSLSVKNAPLDEVLNNISRQTGYNFIYNAITIKDSRLVNLSVKDRNLTEALELCFRNQPLTFVINQNTVVIKRKDLITTAMQSIVVSGTVVDDKGVPLPGVNIKIKGAKTGVVSNASGQYTITLPQGNETLVFSFVGFATQEVGAANRTKLDVTLVETRSALNDVVIIGYGAQKRSDINGAISSVKAEDIANIPQVSVDQLLQGKASGITITQNSGGPGSATSVHIRGITSLSLSNEPLYVIDGVAISGDANNRSSSGRSQALSPNNGEVGVSPLSFLNPSDIENIEVLKDASATAIYGSRGSNGVIIITTKRGKAGSMRIGYDGYYGFQQQGKFLKMMNLKQYARLQNALADNIGQARRGEFANQDLLGEGTDWQDEIFKTAPQQSHQASFSGANTATDYYISGGYVTQDGTVLGNDFRRFNIRTNVNSQVKSWFKVGTTLSASRSIQNTSLSNNTGIIYTALLSAPDQVVRNADGSYAGPQADQVGGQINPVAQALDITNLLTRSNFNGSLYADLKFYKDLTLRSELNGDFNFSAAKLFRPTYSYGPRFINPTASLQEYYTNSNFWSWKEYLTYNHTFGKKHNVTGLLGYELVNSVYNDHSAGVQNFLTNDLQSLNLGDAKTATVGEFVGNNDIIESKYGRIIYTYNNRYSLTATYRIDRSSKFAQGFQTGYFPSFALSWRLSEEPFMAKFKSIADNIKIRFGYGQTGNQGVPSYLYGSALNAVPTGIGTAFAIDKVPNQNLTWETAVQTDLGIDFSLLNNRIDATFDYFDKSSKNFLFQRALPAFLLGQNAAFSGTAVINPPYANGGKLSAKGFEFSINSKNIASKNFKWDTKLIFSRYSNKVLSLYTGVPYIQQNVVTSFLSLTPTRTVVGSPVGQYYGYTVKDIFRTESQLRNAPVQFGRPVRTGSGGTWLGDIQFEDLNNDGKIDENDQSGIGNPNPKFTYGITNTFNYKNFDLSIFLNGSYGAKIYNILSFQTAGLGSLYQNQLASAANFWTPNNADAPTPRPVGGDNPNLYSSNRFVQSGSFLRVQNVSIGYNLPASLIQKLSISRLRVYASGQNLYVFTPYKGLDPEVGSINQNVFLTNVDLGRYPIPRTIVFGINAQF